jgi:hypothetical protein
MPMHTRIHITKQYQADKGSDQSTADTMNSAGTATSKRTCCLRLGRFSPQGLE